MSHHLQRSEQEVQQLWGGGVGDVAAQPGLRTVLALVWARVMLAPPALVPLPGSVLTSRLRAYLIF